MTAARNRAFRIRLLTEQQVDEVQVAHGVGFGADDQLFELFNRVRQREPGGVFLDQDHARRAYVIFTRPGLRLVYAKGLAKAVELE